MSDIEQAMFEGIVFRGAKSVKEESNKGGKKVKTKAKKATYITGQSGSGAAKKKAEIRKKRAARPSQRKK